MYSEEKRTTSVRISDKQKMRLMQLTGTTSVGQAFRRIASELWIPVSQELLDELERREWPVEKADGFDTSHYIMLNLSMHRQGISLDDMQPQNDPPAS